MAGNEKRSPATGRELDGKSSGMEKIPPIFTKPLLNDRFFWIVMGTACLWILALWYIFLY